MKVLQQEKEDLLVRNGELNQELKGMKEENKTLQKKLQCFQAEVRAKEALELENGELKEAIGRERERSECLKSQISKLENLEEFIFAYSDEHLRLEAKLTHCLQDKERLELENSELKKANEELEKAIGQLHDLKSWIGHFEVDEQSLNKNPIDERRARNFEEYYLEECDKRHHLERELEQEKRKNWLNDDQLNGVISKLREEHTSIRLCQTYAFDQLVKYKDHEDRAIEKSGLKARGEATLRDFALIPINYPKKHWALLLWKRSAGELFYLDSLGWSVQRDLVSLDINLGACQLLLRKSGNSGKDQGKKQALKMYDVSVPLQTNTEDCGPLVLSMMKRLVKDDGKTIRELTAQNASTLLKNWFDPDVEAVLMRRQLKALALPLALERVCI